MQIVINYGSFHCKVLLALREHSSDDVCRVVYFSSPPSSPFLSFNFNLQSHSFIALLYFSPSFLQWNFCPHVSSFLLLPTFLISGSLSVAEVKSIKTGRSTCTTTVLHLVRWPAVSLTPAALPPRLVLIFPPFLPLVVLFAGLYTVHMGVWRSVLDTSTCNIMDLFIYCRSVEAWTLASVHMLL